MSGRTRISLGTTFGGFAFAALLVAAVSGIALALPFDASRAYDSVALLLLTSPGARLYRNIHYFAAQAFLILTVAHAWDHLRRSTERRLSSPMWARVTLSLPVAAFLMLSGFMLRGDPEAVQALRIVSTAVEGIPLAGQTLSALLFGVGGLQVVYLHHVATATVFTWLFVAEHGRSVWPRLTPVVILTAAVSAVALVLSPALHDGLDPLVRGPWYFLGLQEILHWLPRPGWPMACALLLLAVLFLLPRFSVVAAPRAKAALAATLLVYLSITAFALAFRGENWNLSPPSLARVAGVAFDPALAVPGADTIAAKEIPVVLGRREGCLFCHREMRGLSASHRPEAVGCASCHAGQPFSLDRDVAHRGMVAIPGNLDVADRTCGTAQCHQPIVQRVRHSMMATMAGVVVVDRAAFREEASGFPDVRSLGATPADTHLRQLCASCHLASGKTEFGAVGQRSRGGGCNACHLTYSSAAAADLQRYVRARTAPSTHPDISIRIGNDHCFGCHSRSGRISTNYEGWMEREDGRTASSSAPVRTRTLDDGRVFEFVSPDVHFEKGLVCVDCHTSREAMGDGVRHARKSEQVRIGCEDCHAPAGLRSVDQRGVDAETRRLLALREAGAGGGAKTGQSGRTDSPAAARVMVQAKAGDVFDNTFVDASGRARQIGKVSGKEMDLKRPASVCVQGGGHSRLSCISCHSAWAPRCSGCHTRFDRRARAYDHLNGRDVAGAWLERGSGFGAAPPTLGIRTVTGPNGAPIEKVEPFVPGMVATIDRNQSAAPTPDTAFVRLYARVFPHTVSKGSRSCESCHNDPVALGYGEGRLEYKRTARGGRWAFTPAQGPTAFDRLPADAWVGFLESVPNGVSRSSRPDVRPFSLDEQERILTVGACLTCHKGDSVAMRDSVADFKAVLRRITTRCVLPEWE